MVCICVTGERVHSDKACKHLPSSQHEGEKVEFQSALLNVQHLHAFSCAKILAKPRP